MKHKNGKIKKASLDISLKKVDFSDVEFLWYLRNQAEVYQYARQNRVVGWEEHINWITPLILGLSSKKLFVIKKQDLSIGQIRFDCLSKDEVEISISILKEFQGKGFAKSAFEKALKELEKNGGSQILVAVINKKNGRSIKFFEKLGFKLEGKDSDWLRYYLHL